MALTNPAPHKGPKTAKDGSIKIRQAVTKAVNNVERCLEAIHKEFITHGSTSMDTALGEDAKAVKRVYSALKDLLESDDIGKEINNLP